MALEFTFVADRKFDFLHAFAEHFALPVAHSQVVIPPALGRSFLRQVGLLSGVALVVHHYQLRQALRIKRLHTSAYEGIVFKFGADGPAASPAVQLGSSSLFAEEVFPANTLIHYLSLALSPPHLFELLALDGATRTRWELLTGGKAFVLYESLTPEMSALVAQLMQSEAAAEALALLQSRIQVQQLLYLLFSKLLARTPQSVVAVKPAEVEKIVAVQQAVLAELSLPPHLPTLVRQSGLSGTKLKHLFRQVFGASIYDYYQMARMQEAARLLHSLTVAETGYRVGLTNLSHFARLFERHYHLTPKKYQAALAHPPLSTR